MNKSLVALAFGTLGLGTAEFVTMGVLPELAQSLEISHAQAGHFISAYALGVCIGAPLCALLAGARPLKHILIGLMAIVAIGNLCSSLSSQYGMLLVSRLIAGLPHGAFFGVGSIVAEKLAEKGKEAQAVSIMLVGITIANLVGVPLEIYLSRLWSWQASYALTGLWGLVTLIAIIRWLPSLPPLPSNGLKGQFVFLKYPAPWFILGITFMLNGGFFCMYSYIAPLFIHQSGFSETSISLLLMLTGAGMCLGNLINGRLADQFGPGRVTLWTAGIFIIVLISLFFLAQNSWIAVILVVLSGSCVFGVGLTEQVLILRHARGGEMIGTASIQIAFNFGNAVGAYLGGIPLSAGYAETYTIVPALSMVIPAFFLVLCFCRKYEYTRKRGRIILALRYRLVRKLPVFLRLSRTVKHNN